MFDNNKFNKLNFYDGELGAIYKKDSTEFRLWSPTASEVKIILFDFEGEGVHTIMDLIQSETGGIWTLRVCGDLDRQYYNYLVTVKGVSNVTVDPYAKAVGVNGERGMVVNLKSTNPFGWENDRRPKMDRVIDSILYEMHIRDFTIDANSGVSHDYKGKFRGVWESGTTIPGTKIKTGIDHLKELGVNTVHLLPIFDYCTVDESKLEIAQYNWGYDPQNYNAPEGSYSLDPFNGEVRIKELKRMIMHLHEAGIRVVMDVVYNHTYATKDSNLNKAVPQYYYRQHKNGHFSNGSGCGNELASERPMVRKFIVDSVYYWAKEYHIDGFRFDLMGLTDIQTMKEIRFKLNTLNKTIILYGEGWTGGSSPLPERDRAVKSNTIKFGSSQIAAFNDNLRDGIKGHVFDEKEKGFVNGQIGFEETIKFGVIAATYHSQIKYPMVANSKDPWANQPYQTINYASAHDNHTLWDKLQVSTDNIKEEELVAMNKLSAAIILTSQGIPFIHSGEEFARTKVNPDGSLNENSYNAPDSVNKLEWKRKEKYKDLFDYYKGLIKIRRNHKAFKMDYNTDIQDNIKFLNTNHINSVIYSINGEAVLDTWKKIIVILNGGNGGIEVDLPEEGYVVVVNEKVAGVEVLSEVVGTKIKVPANSAYILVNKESFIK